MRQEIREGVFETNSSSTHALSIFKRDEWNKFKNGQLWIDFTLTGFLSGEELQTRYNEDLKEYGWSEDTHPFDEWLQNEGYFSIGDLDNYDILTETFPGSKYVAVSFEGWY